MPQIADVLAAVSAREQLVIVVLLVLTAALAWFVFPPVYRPNVGASHAAYLRQGVSQWQVS